MASMMERPATQSVSEPVSPGHDGHRWSVAGTGRGPRNGKGDEAEDGHVRVGVQHICARPGQRLPQAAPSNNVTLPRLEAIGV